MAVHVDNVVYYLLIYQQIVTINYCPSKNKTLSRKDENLALIAVIYIWNMFSNVKMIKSVSIRIQNAEVIKSVLFTNRSYRPLTRNRKNIYTEYIYISKCHYWYTRIPHCYHGHLRSIYLAITYSPR